MTIDLRFKGKLWAIGNSSVITIPAPLAKLLKSGQEYEIVIITGAKK